MFVQNERGRFPTAAGRPDCVDGLARRSDVVRDLHSSAAVAVARDQCSGVCRYPGGLQQRERTTHEQLVGKVRLVPGVAILPFAYVKDNIASRPLRPRSSVVGVTFQDAHGIGVGRRGHARGNATQNHLRFY